MFDIIHRKIPARPWAEGEKIPWDQPGFSERMLKEHLAQEHNMASRRMDIIDRHAAWIHQEILGEKKSRILDLVCGPGLYTERFTVLGHSCAGLDFFPASIQYAGSRAQDQGLDISYWLEDIRSAEFGIGFDLVTFIFGEFNVFRPSETAGMLRKAWHSLEPGGSVLIETHTFDTVKQVGQQGTSWQSFTTGLFSDRPHLMLEENSWDEDTRTATTRYFIIDAESGDTDRYASTMQAYNDEEYERLLSKAGYKPVTNYPSLLGEPDEEHAGLIVWVGRK
ncbi:MAG: class I SAM-dependent methyltransferase [Deltaproteobacteria bacterium]|nr:class I SAM-dependent methyltransferase [Deltaproteobacteria bacterium]